MRKIISKTAIFALACSVLTACTTAVSTNAVSVEALPQESAISFLQGIGSIYEVKSKIVGDPLRCSFGTVKDKLLNTSKQIFVRQSPQNIQ